MRIPSLALVAGLGLLAGCTNGGGTNYNGHNTYEYFPFDGERYWKYTNDGDDVDYNLYVEKVGTSGSGGSAVHTLEYSDDTTGDLLYSIDWTSSAANGVQIAGYEIQGGESVTFDPPMQLADFQMAGGESVETTTGGATYTSTMVGIEECPNLWVDEVWECLHFEVVVDSGTADTDAPFVGDWWGAGSYGASRFRPTGFDKDWVLYAGDWQSESGGE
ncbi:MAG: hypothetical protein H6742_19955 [Alphaproteobacteria bacterium]|nr:hypothetical protein [Alphaproteobacteria bacterium]